MTVILICTLWATSAVLPRFVELEPLLSLASVAKIASWESVTSSISATAAELLSVLLLSVIAESETFTPVLAVIAIFEDVPVKVVPLRDIVTSSTEAILHVPGTVPVKFIESESN